MKMNDKLEFLKRKIHRNFNNSSKCIQCFELKCPNCGCVDLVYDHERGEYICPRCGVVVQEHVIDYKHEWRAFTPEERIERTRAEPTYLLGSHYDIEQLKLLYNHVKNLDLVLKYKIEKYIEKISEILNINILERLNLTVDEVLQDIKAIVNQLQQHDKIPEEIPIRCLITAYFVKLLQKTGIVNRRDTVRSIFVFNKCSNELMKSLFIVEKYLSKKLGDREIKMLIEEIVKYVNKKYKPLIRKILYRLVTESSILKKYFTKKNCMIYILGIFILQQLQIYLKDFTVNIIDLRKEACKYCSDAVIRNKLKILSKLIRIEFY